MKKLICLALTTFSMNIYGEQPNPEEYAKKFSEEFVNCDLTSLRYLIIPMHVHKCIQIINKIQSSADNINAIHDIHVLSILLNVELNELDYHLQCLDSNSKNQVKILKDYISTHDPKDLQDQVGALSHFEKEDENRKELHSIIQEWRGKYSTKNVIQQWEEKKYTTIGE